MSLPPSGGILAAPAPAVQRQVPARGRNHSRTWRGPGLLTRGRLAASWRHEPVFRTSGGSSASRGRNASSYRDIETAVLDVLAPEVLSNPQARTYW